MLKQLLAAGTAVAILAGGTALAVAHGHEGGKDHPRVVALMRPLAGDGATADSKVAPPPPPASGSFVAGTVVAVGSGTVTIQAPAAALPAQLAAVTTGGPKVDVTLPLASQASISASGRGAPDGLAPGERVRVRIQSGAATQVIILGSGDAQPAAAGKSGKHGRDGGDEGRD